MTLIARVRVNLIPVYVGDALVSGPARTAQEFRLPALRTPNAALAEAGAEFGVIRMVQKINLIGDNLIVAWAGSEFQARMILNALSQGHIRTALEAYELLVALPSEETNDVAILGSVWDGQSNLGHFHHNCPEFEFGGVPVSVAGTGAGHFMQYAETAMAWGTNTDDFNRAARIGLLLAATAITEEATHVNHTLEFWGGAMEFAIFHGNGFAKSDRVLFTFWRLVGGELSPTPRVFYYRYFGRTLRVSAIDLESPENGGVFVIPPLFDDGLGPDPESIDLLDFTHAQLAGVVMVLGDDGQPSSYFHFVETGAADLEDVKLVVENSVAVGLDFSLSLRDRILDSMTNP